MQDNFQYFIPIILNISRYFLFAGIPFLIFYILFPDAFSKNKIQLKLAKRKDFIREILHSLQTTFVLAGVGLLILQTPLKKYTQFYDKLSDYPLWWVPVSVLLALLIHDTYFYWMHRAVHHPSLYKRVHLVHHKSVNPSPWASYSFHFLEAVIEGMVAPLILLLIPIHPIALILFAFSSFMINVYGHLGFEIAPKWFRRSLLFEMLNTSTHHNLHHAKFHGNYGLYFRFWDRMMGTEHPDYVKEYDRIQKRRFKQTTPPTTSWTSGAIPVILLILALSALSATSSQKGVEGKWKFLDNGAVIRIYEKEGLYYGQLIETGNEEDNRKLQANGQVILMRNFKKESPTKYCCGTIFAPKKNKTLSATLVLENANTLRVNAKYGMLTGSKTLYRL
jgi:sterol desaturase/sphingolipid hydroxylase (fatty acid hydroxylase superfamily)